MARDLVGERYGHLVVVELAADGAKEVYRRWRCKCDCGRERLVDTHMLSRSVREGFVLSCGCRRSLGRLIGLVIEHDLMAKLGLREERRKRGAGALLKRAPRNLKALKQSS